jgi:hypothetical protein
MNLDILRGVALLALSASLGACGQGTTPDGSTCPDDCLLPPVAYCDADTLVTSLPFGECVNDVCVFQETRSTCSGSCVEGACVAEIDNCGDVVCDSPPTASCAGDVLTEWSSSGTCDPETGDCSYTSGQRDCSLESLVCDNGACIEPDSPCRGVVCEPRAPECDGATSVRWEPGVCVEGTCEYTSQTTDCTAENPAGYCEDGVCRAPDPCEGVVCDAPPEPSCVDDVTVSQYAATGRCDAGDCTYAEAQRSCADAGRVCRDGSCVVAQPCDDVVCDTPPNGSCLEDIATRWGGGVCDARGRCNYVSATENCSLSGEICVGQGRCEPSSCTDGCDAPLASCDGQVAVVQTNGACDEDAERCVYETERTDCAAVGLACSAGECVEVDPCDGVSCETLPPPVCDDGSAVVAVSGVCEDGTCAYQLVADNCAERGATCVDGACVEPDRCADVVCASAPADRCDGDSLVDYPTAGDCDDGTCLYLPEARDCSLIPGGYCFDGACRSTDPCFEVTCDSPPAPTCDLDVAVLYAATGTCGAGRCSYAIVNSEDCTEIPSGYCFDGACASADPCFGIDCAVPPAATCDGNTVVAPLANGECSGGRCLFDTVRTNCSDTGRICSGGVCRSPDPCLGVVCNNPAPPTCDGSDVIVTASSGTCSGGFCSYTQTRVNCALSGGTCRSGACVPGNPCDGLVCNTPPPAICEAQNAVSFGTPSLCVGGACRYTRFVDDCVSDGGSCVDGACESIAPCEGVVCNTPPAPRCEFDVAVVFSGGGTCAGGNCNYARNETNCADTGRFCRDGACVEADPCEGVACLSPPAAVCRGDVAVEYGFPGSCAGGACTYPERTTDCAASGRICSQGSCILDTICLGVDCDVPDRAFCEGDVAVNVDGAGECVDGLCSFTRAETNCRALEQYCFNGACVPSDPCLGVTCDMGPMDRCEGNTAIIASDVAFCAQGACQYPERVEVCSDTGRYCFEGACVVADPCVGVACNAPPPPTCSGLDAVNFPPAGVCVAGECVYAPVLTDCAAGGEVCEAGVCVEGDVCAALTCSIVPNRVCDGPELVVFSAPAACVADECVWNEERFDCRELGGFCSQDRCVSSDPCAGVTCPVSPPATCDDGVAVTYAAGVCSAGGCRYDETRTDCVARGQFCNSGACVAIDPCIGVTCDVAPEPLCDGALVLTPQAPGVCVDGRCEFTNTRTICTDIAGYTCVAGECAPDLCDTITCGGAPSPYCEGDVAFAASGDGCIENECIWPLIETNCAAVGLICQSGRCVADDPCDLISCTTPPPARCDGPDELIRSSSVGACLPGGVCSYAETSTLCSDTGRVCYLGACIDDPCRETTCDAPPSPVCAGDSAVSFAAAGTCDFGLCSYEVASNTDCTLTGRICEDGACVDPQPCSGILCLDAPEDDCVGNFVRTWDDFSGECSEGRCEYDSILFDCGATGSYCFAGNCVAIDPCIGVNCSGVTPAPRCEANTRVVPSGPASCIAGVCGFATEARTDCGATGDFCVAGACVDTDPCDSIVCNRPPPSYCDGTELVEFATPGICVDGACNYRAIETTCGTFELICAGDACVGGLCDGVTCPDPRATCEGTVAVQPQGAGFCNPFDGSCAPPSTTVERDCALDGLVCSGGSCREADEVIQAGDVVMTEFLAVPAGGGAGAQWIELHNTTDRILELAGVELVDPAHSAEPFYVFPGASPIAAGGYVVIGSQAGAASGAATFSWGGPSVYALPEVGGTLVLRIDATVLTSLTWSAALGGEPGTAAQLDGTRLEQSSVPAAWCRATTLYSGSNRGTPGAANFTCD